MALALGWSPKPRGTRVLEFGQLLGTFPKIRGTLFWGPYR